MRQTVISSFRGQKKFANDFLTLFFEKRVYEIRQKNTHEMRILEHHVTCVQVWHLKQHCTDKLSAFLAENLTQLSIRIAQYAFPTADLS